MFSTSICSTSTPLCPAWILTFYSDQFRFSENSRVPETPNVIDIWRVSRPACPNAGTVPHWEMHPRFYLLPYLRRDVCRTLLIQYYTITVFHCSVEAFLTPTRRNFLHCPEMSSRSASRKYSSVRNRKYHALPCAQMKYFYAPQFHSYNFIYYYSPIWHEHRRVSSKQWIRTHFQFHFHKSIHINIEILTHFYVPVHYHSFQTSIQCIYASEPNLQRGGSTRGPASVSTIFAIVFNLFLHICVGWLKVINTHLGHTHAHTDRRT